MKNTESEKLVSISIDGQTYQVREGENLVDVAEENGVFIPSICYYKSTTQPLGTCRACTCKVNGNYAPACMQRVEEGMSVDVNTPELKDIRKAVLEMMFAEGNHFCPSCEKSGDCHLQHMAYEVGLTHIRFPHLFNDRPVDLNSKRMVLDNNRCIKCRRCVEQVVTEDNKKVFMYQNRGIDTQIGIDYEQEKRLNDVQAQGVMHFCPTGAIVVRGKRLAMPFGLRNFDKQSVQDDYTPFGSNGNSNKTKERKTVATVSLAGCFGCHMSLLDIDEQLLDLVDLISFHKSPLTDIKQFGQRCNLGIIEGGCCNAENIETLREFRKNCDILVAVGECSIWGGMPAMRNTVPLEECLEEAFINSSTNDEDDSIVPYHEDLPKLLNRVYACNEIVKIDYLIPGCPPSASHMWKIIRNILWNEDLSVLYHEFKYD